MTEPSEDAVAFDLFLGASTPDVAAIARALRLEVLDAFPEAVEWFDPADGLLAFGSRRSMRDLYFAIIPHKAHVNLQLVDGVDLPNPDGRIEGTGKRVRHVKVRPSRTPAPLGSARQSRPRSRIARRAARDRSSSRRRTVAEIRSRHERGLIQPLA